MEDRKLVGENLIEIKFRIIELKSVGERLI